MAVYFVCFLAFDSVCREKRCGITGKRACIIVLQQIAIKIFSLVYLHFEQLQSNTITEIDCLID